MSEAARRGRPRHGGDVKASYLNMRCDSELRAKVTASAARRGNSMVGEVERLVRLALDVEARG